jgi:hypothetical protein
VKCDSCGEDFHVKPSRLKGAHNNGHRTRFCSMGCRTLARNPVRAARLYPSDVARAKRT